MTYDLRKCPVTSFLLVITIIVFASMQYIYGHLAESPEAIYQFGGMLGYTVKAMPDQLWRLVTPIFIHIGWEHFFINVFTLYFIGQLAEKLWGSKNFLLLYILSGIMGNLFTLVFTPDIVAAGASTSLFGIFAGIIHLGYGSDDMRLRDLAKSYQLLIILNLFMPNVGIAGHVGGIIGGALIAIVLPQSYTQNKWSYRRRYFSAFLYTLIMILSLYYTFR